MHDDDRYAITQRARETLVRLQDEDREREAERLMRGPVHEPIIEPPVDTRWDPKNPRGHKSVTTMSTKEFSSWCDAGKPPLQPEPKPRERHVTKAEMHAVLGHHVTKRELNEILGDVAAAIGESLGLTERNQLATMNAKIAELRSEITDLRKQLDELRAIDAASSVTRLPAPRMVGHALRA